MPRLAFVLQVLSILAFGVALAEQSFAGLCVVAVLLWLCVIDLDINGKPFRAKWRTK